MRVWWVLSIGGRRAATTPLVQCCDRGPGRWPRGHGKEGTVPDATGITPSGVHNEGHRESRREVSAQEGEVRPSARSEPPSAVHLNACSSPQYKNKHLNARSSDKKVVYPRRVCTQHQKKARSIHQTQSHSETITRRAATGERKRKLCRIRTEELTAEPVRRTFIWDTHTDALERGRATSHINTKMHPTPNKTMMQRESGTQERHSSEDC